MNKPKHTPPAATFRSRIRLIAELSMYVADRVRCGMSVTDAMESIRCGRADVDDATWVSVEKRVISLT